ncbi:MAG: zinc dependent phospholipase C family protein [Faecalibacterium prausnitzii]
MPSTYAHRRFGANVLDHLPAPLREKLEAHRELYDIGLHGPDLLFYYHAAQVQPGELRWATPCTSEPGRAFFDRARRVVHGEADRDAALAYALGFVCHFALDSTCHPYVEQFTRESGVTHCEIETEFDNMLLRRGRL